MATSRNAPVTMKGKMSRGIFLVPSTRPWVWQRPGLVCSEFLLLAVMAYSFGVVLCLGGVLSSAGVG
jgi:hypothetical protein